MDRNAPLPVPSASMPSCGSGLRPPRLCPPRPLFVRGLHWTRLLPSVRAHCPMQEHHGGQPGPRDVVPPTLPPTSGCCTRWSPLLARASSAPVPAPRPFLCPPCVRSASAPRLLGRMRTGTTALHSPLRALCVWPSLCLFRMRPALCPLFSAPCIRYVSALCLKHPCVALTCRPAATPAASNGRGLAFGKLYNQRGELVVTVAQVRSLSAPCPFPVRPMSAICPFPVCSASAPCPSMLPLGPKPSPSLPPLAPFCALEG